MSHRDYTCSAFNQFWEDHQKLFPEQRTMLDIGCRDAGLRDYFEAKGFTWWGLDKDDKDGIIVSKMEDMQCVPDESYDLVFSCHSFEHCERPVDALREFQRILKKGGWLFMSTPSPCFHQILGADQDHIFVLGDLQMKRLLLYTGWDRVNSYLQSDHTDREQDFNIISIGVKK